MRIKNAKDFWVGVMFIAFGLAAMVIALNNYQMGTAVRMGPGYLPTVLAGFLAVLGLVVLLGSLAIRGPRVPEFHFRPLLLILAGCVAYGYLMKSFGLVLATTALVVIGALGGHEFRWKEVAVLGVVLIGFSVLVFVKGLGLPLPLLPEFVK